MRSKVFKKINKRYSLSIRKLYGNFDTLKREILNHIDSKKLPLVLLCLLLLRETKKNFLETETVAGLNR
jgi:hypothetical protein